MSIVLSEWTKLRTLRSTLWSFLAASIIAAVQMSRWLQLEPQERARHDAIDVDVGVGGYHLAQLAVGCSACS
jgi:ABC-2 type transport system permease protein